MKIQIKLLVVLCCVLLSSCVSSTNNKQAACSSNIETSAQALEALKAGNMRFSSGEMLHPRSCEARREKTLNSQKPFATIIACSDSRVPVELLFDQGIGDLFVIRTAGNTVCSDVVMGSVDYAIDHLNTPLVVVLGHQNCGGVTSAITVSEHDDEHEHHGKIAELLEAVRENVKPYVGHPEQLTEAIHVNADAQVEKIKEVDYIAKK